MKIWSWPVCGMILAASGWLGAQQGTLSGPLAGFVFDSSARALRPIQGVPGASVVGDPIGFGFNVSSAWVAPGQDSAVVVGTDQSLHFFLLNGGNPAEVSLGGLSGVPESVVFSPSGTAAVLVAQGAGRVLSGLPNAPTLAGTVRVPATGALALSDDATYLLSVFGGTVRLLSVNGQNRRLIAAQESALVAFAAGNHDAAVIDSLNGLTLIRDAAGTAGTQVLATPDNGLANPVGIAFSRDESNLYVASAGAQSVAAFNLAGASRTAVSCACTPTTLVPMSNLFRLTDLTAAPLWLFDGQAATPRTVFVPARAE